MENGKILHLTEVKKQVQIEPKIIEDLELLLEQIKQGDIKAVGIVATTRTDGTLSFFSTQNCPMLLGGIRVLEQDLMKYWDNGYEVSWGDGA